DHAIVRRGLKEIVSADPGIQVAGEATSGAELLQKLRESRYDVVVLDVEMPGRSGLELLDELVQQPRKLPVLILSMHPEDQLAVRTLRAGAAGYLTKEAAPEELVQAIRRVYGGGRYISPTLAELLAGELRGPADRPPHESLSDREFQVFCR